MNLKWLRSRGIGGVKFDVTKGFKLMNIGSVWIELIVVKTENWKHCSKIIFKCVKSTIWPIFNIFNAWTVLLQYVNSTATMHEQWFLSLHNKFTVHALKKKRRKREMKTWTLVSAETKRSHNQYIWDERIWTLKTSFSRCQLS